MSAHERHHPSKAQRYRFRAQDPHPVRQRIRQQGLGRNGIAPTTIDPLMELLPESIRTIVRALTVQKADAAEGFVIRPDEALRTYIDAEYRRLEDAASGLERDSFSIKPLDKYFRDTIRHMRIQELKDRGLILLECISDSRAYELATETSDTDIKGVLYLPKEQLYGLDYIPQVADESNDIVYYELGRFVELLIRNNPNILELLATPEESVIYWHPIIESLKPEMFLSKLCKETFAGYALTQTKKAQGFKKLGNPDKPERKLVLDFCFVLEGPTSTPLPLWLSERGKVQERRGLSSIPHAKGLYALYYDAIGDQRYKGIISGPEANEVSLSSIPKGEPVDGYLQFNKEGYSVYCSEYK